MLKKVNEFGRLSKEAVTAESDVLTQTCTKRLRKTTEDVCRNSLFREWDLHPEPSEFKAGVKNCLLGCYAVKSGINIPIFPRNLLLRYSVQKKGECYTVIEQRHQTVNEETNNAMGNHFHT